MKILHKKLLDHKLALEKERNSIYNSLPFDIRLTLDTMALGIANKEKLDVMEVKKKMVNKINNLSEQKAYYLIANMAELIHKSTQENKQIDDKEVSKEFISFLINLYY